MASTPKLDKRGPYEPQIPPPLEGYASSNEGFVQPDSGGMRAAAAVADWTYRELLALAKSFQEPNSMDMQPSRREPSKPREGMMLYADGETWNPHGGKGMYIYRDSKWHKLQDIPPPP